VAEGIAGLDVEARDFRTMLDDISGRALTHRNQFVNAIKRRVAAHEEIVRHGTALTTGLVFDGPALDRAIVAHNGAAQDIVEAEQLFADDIRDAGEILSSFASRVIARARELANPTEPTRE
jgi:hypothetical protein